MTDERSSASETLPVFPLGGDMKGLINESIRELLREEPTLLTAATSSCARENDQSRGEFLGLVLGSLPVFITVRRHARPA